MLGSLLCEPTYAMENQSGWIREDIVIVIKDGCIDGVSASTLSATNK